ncbi:hypothetical protein [Bradyrhizobium sp. CCBAU 21360]|uniref:hypothetical protein n=1 Tax=Bradyrhizobium sp. CCBAU 21360 TaxID=1325081 RepID=UPI002306355A|nr:hypothetical protein [Bradyrhizobium sp. CCBAU 21360]
MQALTVAQNVISAFAPGALVVTLDSTPPSTIHSKGLSVSTSGFRGIGQAIARIGLPTVFVQEGGYLSDILAANLSSVLALRRSALILSGSSCQLHEADPVDADNACPAR